MLAYQCRHHLEHRDQLARLLSFFDHVVVVEGAAQNRGSTAWCNRHPSRVPHSTDGTRELLLETAAKHPARLRVVTAATFWPSKDEMCRAALDHLRQEVGPRGAYLWQVDADEIWEGHQLAEAERELAAAGADCGAFLCNYYLGPHLVARGDWGEGQALPYRRLWRWDGRQFKTHEPPELAGGNGLTVLLPQRFEHYAYYFEQDVQFKALYYGGHAEVARRWPLLQQRPPSDFPLPLAALFGNNRRGTSQTLISYETKPAP